MKHDNHINELYQNGMQENEMKEWGMLINDMMINRFAAKLNTDKCINGNTINGMHVHTFV